MNTREITPKLVALDIGDVCISIHPDRTLRKLGLLNLAALPKMEREANFLLETGKLTEEEWLDGFMKFTGGKYSRHELLDIWCAMLGPSIPGMADAVRGAVRRGWRFVYFSNTSKPHMDRFLKTNDFCHLVTGAVFSYEAGYAKPDPGIYEVFERGYGVPEFYFDDNAANIAQGKARGWNAVQFRSPDQLNSLLY